MDEELLAWNMELFHPLQPGTTVADPILKNIQSSGQRIDDDVRNGNITNLRAELFEFAQQMQGTVAFAMLKGGLAGGLNPVASSVIRDMLSGRQEITPASVYSGVNTTVRGKTFASTIPATVYSGIPSDLSVEDFIKRWGNAPAKMKQYRRMHDGATAEGKDHMLKVMDGRMSQMDGTSYRAWLGRLNEHFKKWSIDPEEVAIINDSSDYALAQVQPLMVVFEKPVAASNAQDTLKKMMGKTNPLESEPGTIRARMVQELDLAQRAKYPIIRNVIHCPTSDEQRLEIDLMPEGDVRYFVSVARRLKEKAK
jgi:hypothetical protein